MPTHHRVKLGVVTSGSFVKGLHVRLSSSVEDIRVGKFVVIHGEKHKFFSMVTDVALESTSRNILADPPEDQPFLHQVLSGTLTYGSMTLMPRLMLPNDRSGGLLPVKTVPRHFSMVYDAEEEDFNQVFGKHSAYAFEIGQPVDMDVPVYLDLERFVERSNGIFGKSGTGKSFLTRLILCGTIAADIASNLVFDMHSEYGWSSSSESGQEVKGLRQLFGSDVQVYALHNPNRTHRGAHDKVDGELIIGLDQIEVEDVLQLQEELNLSSAAAESSYLLADAYKKGWLRELLAMDGEDIKAFAESRSGHVSSITALKRKLERIKGLEFVKDQADFPTIDRMIDALARGLHVVLDFGGYDSVLAYVLVANIITRRIHRRWVQWTEQYRQNAANRPRQLMITIEEAHKFLKPTIARQTIFGKIAREMRKYGVTLLVVDQRPSSIDTEVMSQLGTRITALLNDERDIDAVFAGISGSGGLKAVLATLDTKQQAMVLGHAVPMAVVIRTRPYDQTFYQAIGSRTPQTARATVRDGYEEPTSGDEGIDELFPLDP